MPQAFFITQFYLTIFNPLNPIFILGVSVMNGLVYAVGGFNGSLRVRTVDVYDPIKDMWSSIASMEARRSTLGSAILNGMIYAVGGFDGSSGKYGKRSQMAEGSFNLAGVSRC